MGMRDEQRSGETHGRAEKAALSIDAFIVLVIIILLGIGSILAAFGASI